MCALNCWRAIVLRANDGLPNRR